MDSPIGAIPLGHAWCFRREDFPKNANKISQKFTCTFCMTSASVLNHPAYSKLEGLDLSGWHVPSCHGRREHWHSPIMYCNVGHACCSIAAEQMRVLPNGSVHGPERNNSLLYCHLHTSSFFILPPLQIQWGTKQIPWLSKNVLVLFSVGAYSLESLESLDTCSTHKVQTLAFWNMHCFNFCPYLCVFLMYTQLLMNWREEMLCCVLGWPCIRLRHQLLGAHL